MQDQRRSAGPLLRGGSGGSITSAPLLSPIDGTSTCTPVGKMALPTGTASLSCDDFHAPCPPEVLNRFADLVG
jgi:hypothetical protein